MAFCSLFYSYSRNHLQSVLWRNFGKHNPSIWRSFLRSSFFQTRCTLSSSCVSLSKTFSGLNKKDCSCSCVGHLGTFGTSGRKKVGLHSSNSLLLQRDAVNFSEESDSEKDVKKCFQTETGNLSSVSDNVNEQHSDTFDGQNQVVGVSENTVENGSLISCGTIAEHVTLLKDAKRSVERSLSETQDFESIALQKRVVLTPGW